MFAPVRLPHLVCGFQVWSRGRGQCNQLVLAFVRLDILFTDWMVNDQLINGHLFLLWSALDDNGRFLDLFLNADLFLSDSWVLLMLSCRRLWK